MAFTKHRQSTAAFRYRRCPGLPTFGALAAVPSAAASAGRFLEAASAAPAAAEAEAATEVGSWKRAEWRAMTWGMARGGVHRDHDHDHGLDHDQGRGTS